MYQDASESDVNRFLSEAKRLLQEGKFTFWERKKNLDSIAEAGLLPGDVLDTILDLDVHDYYKGPKPDFDHEIGGEIWEFKTYLEDVRFYIKLKVEKKKGPVHLECLSFHKDEF